MSSEKRLLYCGIHKASRETGGKNFFVVSFLERISTRYPPDDTVRLVRLSFNVAYTLTQINHLVMKEQFPHNELSRKSLQELVKDFHMEAG